MKVERGDKVLVRYTGRLATGEVFDTNAKDERPLAFLVGGGEILEGLENAVVGLAKGEARTVQLAPEDAYGEHDERLVTKLDAALFDTGLPDVGEHLELEDAAGQVYHADVVDVKEDGVTVDLNHHLAGHTLTFDISVEGIERA